MKNKFLLILFFVSTSLFAQHEQLKEFAERDAKIAAEATLKGDYDLLLKHTFPQIIELMGGKENAKTTISSMMENMKQQGFVFEKADVVNISDVVKEDGEYRCYVENANQMKMGDTTRIKSKSFLLGVYNEQEKIWHFIEAEKLSNQALVEQVLPGFKTSLKIPKDEMKMETIE